MSGEKVHELRQFLEQRRDILPLEACLHEWIATGIDFLERREKLRAWMELRGSQGREASLTPDAVTQFIARIASLAPARSVLDPVCGSGYLLGEVAGQVGNGAIHAVDINRQSCGLARLLLPEHAAVHEGDVLKGGLELQSEYDLIVAEPPFGLRFLGQGSVPGATVNLPRNPLYSDALVWWCAARLSSQGTALLLLTTSFLSASSRPAWQALAEQGRFVRACIHLPHGTLQGSSIESYLVVIDRVPRDKIFVAQYSPNDGHQKQLLENLEKHRSGGLPEQGRLVAWEDFDGYAVLQGRERAAILARRMGFEAIAMAKLVVSCELVNIRNQHEAPSPPNCVYLSRAGRKAATNPDKLSSRTSNYFRLQINEEFGDARFVAEVLNRELGQAVIASAMRGGTISTINQQELMQSKFYLPSVETQRQRLEGMSDLERLRAELDELDSGLWGATKDTSEVLQRIKKVNHQDRFEDWVDTLPFPLASILWRHHVAKNEPIRSTEILLHFFEAMAEFLATVHLSALRTNEEAWATCTPSLLRSLQGQDFKKATFGVWKNTAEYLGKQSRGLLSESEQACLERYCTRSVQVVRMLTDSRISQILQTTNEIRNRRAHGGVTNDDEETRINEVLRDLLQQCRGIMGRNWLEYELVQPRDCRRRNGIYHHDLKRVMGTRLPFESIERECSEVLEEGALYLLPPSGGRALELLPFVRLMASPKEAHNACYFYNRMDGGKAKYVSYHFDGQPEVSQEFRDASEVVEKLMLSTPDSGRREDAD